VDCFFGEEQVPGRMITIYPALSSEITLEYAGLDAKTLGEKHLKMRSVRQ